MSVSASDEQRIREIEEREAACSPAIWSVRTLPQPTPLVGEFLIEAELNGEIAATGGKHDAAFIAHAREDIPYLLALLRVWEQETAEREKAHEQAMGVLMAVIPEVTTVLMREFMEQWKDGRHVDLTPERVQQAIQDGLDAAVRKGIPRAVLAGEATTGEAGNDGD